MGNYGIEWMMWKQWNGIYSLELKWKQIKNIIYGFKSRLDTGGKCYWTERSNKYKLKHREIKT